MEGLGDGEGEVGVGDAEPGALDDGTVEGGTVEGVSDGVGVGVAVGVGDGDWLAGAELWDGCGAGLWPWTGPVRSGGCTW